jgi:hypothetical protein
MDEAIRKATAAIHPHVGQGAVAVTAALQDAHPK